MLYLLSFLCPHMPASWKCLFSQDVTLYHLVLCDSNNITLNAQKMLILYRLLSATGDESGDHTAPPKFNLDSCDSRCTITFVCSCNGQSICFCLADFELFLLEVFPDKALISGVGLNFSKTGLVTGRQAFTTPSDCSRQVRTEISAYWPAVFSAVMSVVTLIRTRVMIHMVVPRENNPLIATFLPTGI